MTVRRRALLVVIACVIGLAGALWSVPSADALEEEPLTVPARATVEADYGPIPASEPATVTIGGVVTPAECAALPSCALVPLDIEAPADVEPGDDFYVITEVSWVDESHTTDLDVFLFDDGQTHEAEGGDGSVYTEKGSSASADNPERIQLYEPLLGRYNLVVQNFTGAGVFWHLKVQSIVGEFEAPTEMLAPPPGGGTTNPNNKPTTTTTRPSPTTTAPTTTTVSIPEGVVLPDADFESGEFDPATALDELASDEEALAAIEAGSGRNADSPSTMSVILWMVVVPVVLLGAVGAYLLSRRQKLRVRAATR